MRLQRKAAISIGVVLLLLLVLYWIGMAIAENAAERILKQTAEQYGIRIHSADIGISLIQGRVRLNDVSLQTGTTVPLMFTADRITVPVSLRQLIRLARGDMEAVAVVFVQIEQWKLVSLRNFFTSSCERTGITLAEPAALLDGTGGSLSLELANLRWLGLDMLSARDLEVLAFFDITPDDLAITDATFKVERPDAGAYAISGSCTFPLLVLAADVVLHEPRGGEQQWHMQNFLLQLSGEYVSLIRDQLYPAIDMQLEDEQTFVLRLPERQPVSVFSDGVSAFWKALRSGIRVAAN